VAEAPTPTAADSVRGAAWLDSTAAKIAALAAFGILAAVLIWVGLQRPPKEETTNQNDERISCLGRSPSGAAASRGC
jgi:hypothetical protein